MNAATPRRSVVCALALALLTLASAPALAQGPASDDDPILEQHRRIWRLHQELSRMMTEADPLPPFPDLDEMPQLTPGFGNRVSRSTMYHRSTSSSFTLNGERFTSRHRENGTAITLSGTVRGGKATVSEVRVEEGGKEVRYTDPDKVPEKHQKVVRGLLRQVESKRFPF